MLALQPKAASAWLRAGPLFELTPALKGAAKVRTFLALQPLRVFRLAAGGASLSSPPSPPQGRYIVRYVVSAAVGGPVNAATAASIWSTALPAIGPISWNG